MKEGFQGNPLIKGSGVNVQFTSKMVEEYTKCMLDPVYFCRNYVQIVNVDKGLIPFDLYPYQERIIKTIDKNRFVICKLPRQSGKSSSIGCGSVLHFALFNKDKKIAILANKEKSAKKLLADIKKGFEYLPSWLQQGVVEWNKTSVVFENGSSISVSATSADSARGDSYSMIVLDEFAFIGETQADEFFKSVYPTISSGKETRMIIVSTPNGMNHFYKMWTEAIEKRSDFIPIEIDWRETPGRDEQWRLDEISRFGEKAFNQEYACVFYGSSNTLLSGPCLASLVHRTPISQSGDGLDIYEHPKEEHEYVMCVDVASGNKLDYSAFTVMDISEYPFKMVAKYRNNELSTMIYPEVIYRVAMKYNKAWVLIEQNQDGGQVSNDLHDDFEYENMIFVHNKRGRKGQVATLEGFGKNVQLGVKTSPATKRIGCSMLRTLMEDKKLIVEDFDAINEFSTFVSKKKSFEAEEGRYDDIVMSLVLFGWLTSQNIFNELIDINVKEAALEQRRKKEEDIMTPMGFFDDGSEHVEEESFVDNEGQFWEAIKRDDDFDIGGLFY